MAIHELFPYLHVDNAGRAIEFYTRAFGVKELFRLTEPSGRIGHAELDFNGAVLMLCDEFPEYGIRSAATLGATSVTLHLHVDDADALIAQAVAAGASLDIAPQDHFYGERSGSIRDPFGHRWNIGHSIEKVAPEEMQRRYTELLLQGDGCNAGSSPASAPGNTSAP
ncbi:VOC family protein [Variovorax terrae]|uniref:VOC family protein n=1 Tax=Variovorax terrae TaxID=2923278 RepID=A0A9X2AMB7_9BURK|nr:VOC family protein [Variovorax terrae]MCJ0763548.1 VOC family protein [Variovorax terrae]